MQEGEAQRGRMPSWQGRGVDSDENDDKDPNGNDGDENNNLILDTTANLWSDAFLAGRGG